MQSQTWPIPHRPPFLFVDRILDLEPGRCIVAAKEIREDDLFLKGHFPGNPIMPGVLQIEALSQAGGILCHESKLFHEGNNLPVLAAIKEARFRRLVRPGECLELHVEIARVKKKMVWLEAKAYVDRQLSCEAILVAALMHVK